MGALGAAELLILLLGLALPFGVLGMVASRRGQSAAYVLWGLLSWLGVIIGLLMMIAMPRKNESQG